ncbi:MAG: Na+/H+ antiporter NhaC family protein [Desulfobacterales bacterium]|nr:MAG: Na+/H+ antiporter NhaC family protein [Desulfobacterales bacterium]
MKKLMVLALTIFIGLLFAAHSGAAPVLKVEGKGANLSGLNLYLKVTVENLMPGEARTVAINADGKPIHRQELTAGEHEIKIEGANLDSGTHTISVESEGVSAETELRVLPGWLSLLPPVIAIVLALLIKDVLISLSIAIFIGALSLAGWNPFAAFSMFILDFIVKALIDEYHASIILFSMLLGGMVGIISKNGGTRGIVDRVAPFATTPRRAQLAAWLMGLLVFFDDYANTLIVGNTMRPVTDRLRISREKLSYIVDSTAAPVSSVFPITTWIGFEVGLIAAGFAALEIPFNAYNVFIASILYRFYPIFCLIIIFVIAWTGRDLGPMLKAERRARQTGDVMAADAKPLADFGQDELAPPGETPKRAMNALIPILTVIVVTILGLWITGTEAVDRTAYTSTFKYVQDVFSNANSFSALLWASLSGVVVALIMTFAQRLLNVRDAIGALVGGLKAMVLAMAVLLLAWCIGTVCSDLHTADYVVSLISGLVSPVWLPVLTFVISAVIALATGTSWGTMAILMALVIPICHELAIAAGHGLESGIYYTLMVGTISSVLAGSVWGDHCSPISDTTILSSMASGCDHVDHVKTQLPYAMGIGLLGMLVGDIPTAFGLSPWISILLGTAVIVVGVRFLFKKNDVEETEASEETDRKTAEVGAA